MKSARLNLVRFLFVLPLAAILLLAFRKNQADNSPGSMERYVTDSLPAGTKSISLHRDDDMDQEHRDFFDKNPSVILLHWNIQKNTMEIYKKNGEVEKYDLSISSNEAEAIYGKLPLPEMGSYSGIYASTGDCFNRKGYCIEIIGVNGHSTVVVKNKNNKIVEQVDLLKWNANKDHYESLYGKIPPTPPPPPPPPPPPAKATSAVPLRGITTEINQVIPVATTSVSTSAIPIKSNIAQASQEASISTPVVSIANNEIAAVSGVASYNFESPVGVGEDDLQFQIKKSTTRDELEQMILKAKEKGAILKFDEIKYNEKNQLVYLSGTFKNKDDHSDFKATGFQKVILTMIKKDGRSQFIIEIVVSKKVS